MKPTIGRIVHLHVPEVGHCIAAIVVRVFDPNLTTVNLRCFADQGATMLGSGNDRLNSEWWTSVQEGPISIERPTWHWPERED